MKKPVANNSAPPTGELSNKLKSLVGVQPSQGTNERPVGWNASTVNQSTSTTSAAAQQQSLKEIMDEQERILKANKANTEGANAVAVKHTWAGKLGAQPAYSAPAPIPAPAPAPTAILARAAKQATAPVPPAAPVPVPPAPVATASQPNMTVELEEWCKLQMQKLGKPQELTLMSFCMEIESASEIREYFSDYFGSTPQVSLFASDFIKKKDALLKNKNKNLSKK